MPAHSPDNHLDKLLEAVIARLGSVKGPDNKDWHTALCPFHDDHHPSLRFTSSGFMCMACGHKGAIGALAAKLGIAGDSTQPEQSRSARGGSIAHQSLDVRQSKTRATDDPWQWWQDKTGLPREAWEALGVVFDSLHNGHVFSFHGTDVVKVRPLHGPKYLWDPPGVTTPPLWPVPKGKLPDEVIFAAGESDCATLRYAGYEAFGLTKGEATPVPAAVYRTLKDFGVRCVTFIPDMDEAGESGALARAQEAQAVGLNAKIAHLSDELALVGGKDVNDLWRWCRTDLVIFKRALDAVLAEAMPIQNTDADSFASVPRDDGRMNESNAAITFLTAAELSLAVPEEVPWVWDGFFAEGSLTLISGKPKLAGKTTLLLHAVAAILAGKPFLGRPTKRTVILYLTEERDTTLRAALGRAGLTQKEGLILLQRSKARADWPVVVEAAAREALQRGARLLVVDTLAEFVGLGKEAEKDAGAMLQAISPLQWAAAQGLAVVIAHHDRKSGGEVGDSARGSNALIGAVDITISIERTEGGQARRVLRTLSRFEQTPANSVVEFTNSSYRLLGTAEDVAQTELESQVMSHLPAEAAGGLSVDDLVNEVPDVGRTKAHELLAQAFQDGRVGRIGTGKRGSPYRYFRPSGTNSLPADENESDPQNQTHHESAVPESLLRDAADNDTAQSQEGEEVTEWRS